MPKCFGIRLRLPQSPQHLLNIRLGTKNTILHSLQVVLARQGARVTAATVLLCVISWTSLWSTRIYLERELVINAVFLPRAVIGFAGSVFLPTRTRGNPAPISFKMSRYETAAAKSANEIAANYVRVHANETESGVHPVYASESESAYENANDDLGRPSQATETSSVEDIDAGRRVAFSARLLR
ncbi:hypothetical protein PHMEG_00031255 [Phytophthora megakarya]|uniref:Uncharacterized protein n=1 Tax=Phytophthora megakarya TaxID=4795 RepID=A0A225UYQ6_9STRA|nr:hypothetical protein PHMEG_00031255 [Phytophthora megakarya]